MIIGLAGFKGSGKDTVAAYLVKEHGFERKAFADPLKRSVAALFDIPFSEVDKLKNNPDMVVMVGEALYDNEVKTAELSLIPSDMTFRHFLQRYGTESHRDVFGENFWVDQTLPVRGFYPGRAIVVTDVRFNNEAERVRSLGGLIWYIDRMTDREAVDPHASESIDFDIDHTVYNHGSLDELSINVEHALACCVASTL